MRAIQLIAQTRHRTMAGFLAMAVLLHLLLLALPLRLATSSNATHAVSLQLRWLRPPQDTTAEQPRSSTPRPAAVPVDPEESSSLPRSQPVPANPGRGPEVRNSSHQASALEQELHSDQDSGPVSDQVPQPPWNAAILFDSLSQLPPLKGAGSRPSVLGQPRPYAQPENWRPGAGAAALAGYDNRFDDSVVPAEVEVVDRWLAADGSQNVVVNAPNGKTYCGRALPYDPRQPLVEHIMMFHECGGGGKRSFELPPRAGR